jgi:hypothetical protein
MGGVAMITFVRTAVAAPGKGFDLLAYAKEIAATVKATIGKDLTTAIMVGGNANQVCWMLRYESLAELEATIDKLNSDAGYREMVKKSEGIILANSVHDQIWRDY